MVGEPASFLHSSDKLFVLNALRHQWLVNLASGLPPVYIGFGSMTGIDPERLTKIALQALVKSVQRGILATGWGGLTDIDLPDGVIQIK